jgi:NTP pyrophosphatase (non-canonical NTP hydrolase)
MTGAGKGHYRKATGDPMTTENIRYQPSVADLPARIVAWHTARFPAAQATHVGLKLCAEAGEVADAIVGDSGVNSGTGAGDVGAEAADVFIALTVLLGRWYPDVDLMAEVERKVRLLETPGAHKSSAIEGGLPWLRNTFFQSLEFWMLHSDEAKALDVLTRMACPTPCIGHRDPSGEDWHELCEQKAHEALAVLRSPHQPSLTAGNETGSATVQTAGKDPSNKAEEGKQ